MKKNQQIRNSTAEFLIFAMQGDAEGIEVRLEDDTVWLTQQMLAELYGTTKQNISLHILNIYEEEELSRFELSQNLRQLNRSAFCLCSQLGFITNNEG